MTLQVNRFEVKDVKKPGNVQIQNLSTMLIKDHQDDNIIGLVQLYNDRKKNKALAEKVIETIEDFIVENGDESEDKD